MMIDEDVVEIVSRFALWPTVSFLSVEFLLKIEMSSFSKLDVFSQIIILLLTISISAAL